MDNNNFATSGAAPAPAITSQPTTAQDGISPQINPKKLKAGLIIGIAVIISAIIIGTIIIIPIISSKNTNEGREEGGSSVSSSEGDSGNDNKSQKRDGKLILGINSKTITVTNNLKSVVSEFVKAGYSVTYMGTNYDEYKKEKVQLTTNNLEDIFKNTSLTISSEPCFSIKTEKDEYGVYDVYSIFGIMPGHVNDDKNTDISNIPKVALSEFELATLEVNGDNINYSINGKSFNSQNASYDEIKKAFGREADKIDDGYFYYNEDSFEVEIIAGSGEINGINIEPIR